VKILVCMLEFPSWPEAKPWSYISGYAFVDALREAGHDVELTVLLSRSPSSALVGVVEGYAARGEHFECAFFWMPHLDYSSAFWAAAARIANRRVGVLIESLRYTREETRLLPHLADRRRLVLRNLRNCTHVVTLDYHDFQELKRSGFSAFWTPGIVPRLAGDGFAPFEEKAQRILTAGTIYPGKREAFFNYLVSKDVIGVDERLEHSPNLIAAFEQEVGLVARELSAGRAASPEAVERIRLVRLALWYEYLAYLSRFACVVSLPAYFKGFPGRIFEGIITNCAVVIYEGCDFHREKQIFRPAEHIYYLPTNGADEDIARFVDMTKNQAARRQLTAAAHERALATCEASVIADRIAKWVASDSNPVSQSFRNRVIRRWRLRQCDVENAQELGYEIS
jgi:hypothetical protein